MEVVRFINSKLFRINSNPIRLFVDSEEELMGVMRNFNASLGVKFSFCHAPGVDGKMDSNKQKDVARGMMIMTINKRYFKTKNPKEFQVNCFTCYHRK